MTKYSNPEISNHPFPHTHLWQEYEDKDKKTNRIVLMEQCKFCKIVRVKSKK